MGSSEIPESHREFIQERAKRYFARPATRPRKTRLPLRARDPGRSRGDRAAVGRGRAAPLQRAPPRSSACAPSSSTKDDYGRIAEFDALFIRETTAVNHHTYRFARRAPAEGMVVIDDPESIIRCTNKVYQAELFARQSHPAPATLVVHRENVGASARSSASPAC